jgi:hypothetical protein
MNNIENHKHFIIEKNIWTKMDSIGNKTGKYGGSIREAGGAIGSMGVARENEYFKRVDEEKIENFKRVEIKEPTNPIQKETK